MLNHLGVLMTLMIRRSNSEYLSKYAAYALSFQRTAQPYLGHPFSAMVRKEVIFDCLPTFPAMPVTLMTEHSLYSRFPIHHAKKYVKKIALLFFPRVGNT